jgi:hypothetical protein
VTLFNAAAIVDAALIALRFAIIAVGCFAFYRWLRLKALPWVGAWYVVGYVAEIAVGYIYRRCTPTHWRVESHTPPPSDIAALSTAVNFTAEISALLAVLLIFSEAAFIMQRLFPDRRPVALRVLCRIHNHVVALGIASVALVAAEPLFPLVYCYARAHR